jgi:hypothetical protein
MKSNLTSDLINILIFVLICVPIYFLVGQIIGVKFSLILLLIGIIVLLITYKLKSHK